MSEEIFQLLYVSSATPQLDEKELLNLLANSQKRNTERGITGLLLHSEGSIIQVLEGEQAEVDKLYAKIEQDKRHTNVMLLSRRTVAQRDFPQYKMGFRRTDPELLKKELPGFTDIVEKREISPSKLEGISKLVSTFLVTFARTTRLDP